MSDENAIDITVRLPRPGEDRAAYEAYLDDLFAPVRAEMDRLRAALIPRGGGDDGEDDQS